MVKFKIGYTYKQKYVFEGREGFTQRCVLHTLNDKDEIVKTYDYKVGCDLPAVGSVVGAPLFDKFNRLCAFATVQK